MAAQKRILGESKKEISKKPKSLISEVPEAGAPFFLSVRAFLLPAGMGSARLSLFKMQILKHGGQVFDKFDEQLVNHVLVDDSVSYERAKALLLIAVGSQMSVDHSWICIKVGWLSQCLKLNRLVDTEQYEVKGVFRDNQSLEVPQVTSVAKNQSDSNIEIDKTTESHKQPYVINTGKFICASSSEAKRTNFNEHITSKLETLGATYKNTKDQWRALGYEKAVSALKSYGKPISSREEAQGLPGIGERLADKIWEIVEFGRLQKMEEVCNDDHVVALNLFANVWGVGPATAQQFVQQGFRTLDDLREKGNLNRQQRIGLQHYDDILDRMPRDEATKIEQMVRKAALSLVPDLVVIACGSYRRGKSTCGDVDVLVTHADGQSHVGLLPRILKMLHQSGFLTDDLVAEEENGGQRKYMGVCRLPGPDTKHRRLDIIVVPYDEYACCLLYFTGSAHFNRSMRLLARKMGMTLSEHALRTGVIRRGTEKVFAGNVLPTPTEESVFQHLGLTYRAPAERDH